MNSEDILQHCLSEIIARRKTPVECAAQYPQRPHLLAQLQAAAALMAWPPATMAPAATRRHQAQLRAALAAAKIPHQRQPRRLAFFPHWATVAMLILTVVLGSAGTVSATAGSLPGQALYPIKRAAERLQTSLRPAAQQAAWHAGLADERTRELAALLGSPAGSAGVLQELVSEVNSETEVALSSLAAVPDDQLADLLDRLLAQIERQQAVLATVYEVVPTQAKAGIAQALAVSRAQREAAITRLEAVRNRPQDQVPPGLASRTPTGPTEAPPGQAKKTATATVPPGQAKKTVTPPAPVATDLPPGQERKTATAQIPTDLPPGQIKKTETAAAQSAQTTPTPPGNSGGQGTLPAPNCSANNPNSPNYCTPAPSGVDGLSQGESTPPPPENVPGGAPPTTSCPLNPAGNPTCGNRP